MSFKNPEGELISGKLKCILDASQSSWRATIGEGCGSSDGMHVYYHKDYEIKNHQLKCFVCNRSKYLSEEEFESLDISSLSGYKGERNKYKKVKQMINPNQSVSDVFLKGVIRPVRGLNADTLTKYGVTTTAVKVPSAQGSLDYAEVVNRHIYPYYDKDGLLIAQKIRHVYDARLGEDKKGFEAIGDKGAWNRVQLFGQHLFPAGSAQKVTITEGEIDAMSVYQMLGSKYPSVSLINGAHSVRKMLENKDIYKYLDSFDEIIVCFDNDEHGQKATEVFCEIFPSKTKMVSMSLKDANEYLLASETVEFTRNCWWKAKQFTPDGLALSSEFIPDVVNSSVARGALPYPFKELNKKLFGMRQAELTVWVAGTGSGKSTMQREIVNHIKNVTSGDVRIGMLMLEESPNKTAMGLVGLELGKPLLLYELDQQLPKEERILKDMVITPEEKAAAAQKMLGDDRIVIMRNSFQGSDLENIVKKVRQMNKVYNCQHIILDHISIIVSGQDQEMDERKSLDKITTNLRRLVEETGINLHLVSHLKRPDGKGFEDGAEISLGDIRGTAAIAQLSDNVIGLERNQQNEDSFIRNVIRFRVLKCRVTGLTGLAGYGYYNAKTGRIEQLSNEDYESYVEALEEKTKKKMQSGIDFPVNM